MIVGRLPIFFVENMDGILFGLGPRERRQVAGLHTANGPALPRHVSILTDMRLKTFPAPLLWAVVEILTLMTGRRVRARFSGVRFVTPGDRPYKTRRVL